MAIYRLFAAIKRLYTAARGLEYIYIYRLYRRMEVTSSCKGAYVLELFNLNVASLGVDPGILDG